MPLIRPNSVSAARVWLAGGLALVAACATPIDITPNSPLRPPTLAPNTIVIDYATARYPDGDQNINVELWKEIDEQRLDAALRRRLADNGLRAGIVGAKYPPRLERLVKLGETAPAETEDDALPVVPDEPAVRQRQRRLASGTRFQIVLTGEFKVHEQMSLLSRDDEGHVTGKTYRQAKGLFDIRATAEGASRVRLNVVPHVEHGQPQPSVVPQGNHFQVSYGPPHEIFSSLEIDVALAPGETLVLGGLHERPGSLGHHFLTEIDDGPAEQKLLLLRLTQTQFDDLFMAGESPKPR